MRAIILAAGRGKRLIPHTNSKPKAMLEFGNKPLIQYSIDNLRKVGIADITIITGYKSEMINIPNVRYIHNEKFAETNMVYTLFCAEAVMDDNLIISYSDIIFEPKVLQKLLQSKDEITVVVDDNWQELWELKSNNPLNDAETLRLNKKNYILEIGAKPKDLNQIDSQYIGLLKFSKKGIRILKKIYHELKDANRQEIVIRGRTFNQLYMTDVLQLLIDNGHKVKGVRIKGGWLELDSKEEYEKLLDMYKEGKLNHLCDLAGITNRKKGDRLESTKIA